MKGYIYFRGREKPITVQADRIQVGTSGVNKTLNALNLGNLVVVGSEKPIFINFAEVAAVTVVTE